MTTGSPRLDLVRAKAEKWADELIDLGPRNTLLRFRQTKATLDLTNAAPHALAALFEGRKTRLSALLTAPEELERGRSSARLLRGRLVALTEEQGVDAGRVARVLIKVAPPSGKAVSPLRPLHAPLLLQAMSIEPRTAGETDYTLELLDEPEVNPVLLHALNRQFGVDLDPDETAEKLRGLLAEAADPGTQVELVYQALRRLIERHGLRTDLDDRVLAGVFSFEKLPMVRDLKDSPELLAAHDVIAAAAGFTPAAEHLQAEAAAFSPPRADDIRPEDEFLVFPADSSQHEAIMAALHGQHVVIQGPPGTGKSQTIANIIAGAVAHKQRILFVAEKRAAIEAVTDRLQEAGLGHLVFDLHDQKLNKRKVVRQIAESIEQAGKELAPRENGLHRRLVERRNASARHVHALHDPREPWGISVFEVYEGLLDTPGRHRSALRWRGAQLHKLSGQTREDAEEDLSRFADLGGLELMRGESPWSRSQVRDTDTVADVVAKLDALTTRSWRDAHDGLLGLVAHAGLRQPSDLVGWQELLALLSDVERTVAGYGPEVFAAPLEDLCFATGTRAWRSAHPRQIGRWQRRALRKRGASMARSGARDKAGLHAAFLAASHQLTAWRQRMVAGGGPVVVPGLAAAARTFAAVRDQLAAVAMCAGLDQPERWPEDRVRSALDELNGSRDQLARVPEVNRIGDRLRALGLEPLLQELAQRKATADEARSVFNAVWHASLLEECRLRDPYLAQFTGKRHDHEVADFRAADAEHLTLNAQRVRRRHARRLVEVRDQHGQQNKTVIGEAKRRRGHMPIRRLVAQAPDVLMAARPCWAMSPMVVSRLLPAQRLFDVVIFDEASQVEPYDAMASIMRGRQLVVAGDEKQLPPTAFFRKTLGGDSDDSGDLDDETDVAPPAAVGDFESILQCLASLIPRSHMLTWHYRSHDERLIAFSNQEIYDNRLVAFPGHSLESPLRLDLVDACALPGSQGTTRQEISRVVELIVEHVREHPQWTLGVIAMNIKAASMIESALRETAGRTPELTEFMARMQGPRQRLFVKNLERVQGDERDAIILSIGYAKQADGRLPMRFGPLNVEGGERRLNVAVSRAQRRMTLVSAFSHHDMAPDWHTAGPELLRRFLAFAADGGDPRGVGRMTPTPANGFERSIGDALMAAGVPFVPQWGVSGYRIDFALQHPKQPGRMVLAVEADGDSYHRSPSARDRDRLRQEHLELLGWRFHRVWASAWFSDPEGQTERIIEAWTEAVAAADAAVDRPGETGRAGTPPPPPSPSPAAPGEPRRGPRTFEPHRGKIDLYSDRELLAAGRWVLSDGLLLDRETRVGQVMGELGLRRRGARIVARINVALDRASRTSATKEA